MPLDISSIKYSVELITETGAKYLLDDVLLSVSWEEQMNELSQRATVSLVNVKIGDTWLMAIAKLNCVIRIHAQWSASSTQSTKSARQSLAIHMAQVGATQVVFQGTIWEWEYNSAQKREITLTAYDNMIWLQQSKDYFYFAKGMSTQQLIGAVCKQWNVTLSYTWRQSITHEKKIFNANSISDIIFSLLEEVKDKRGEKYLAYFSDGALKITGYGENEDVYRFDTLSTISTDDKQSMSELVTRVKIIGKGSDTERAQVYNTLDGDTRFGVLQEILVRDSDKTMAQANEEAQTLLRTKGTPESTMQAIVPDLPFLRKGELVEMAAGDLLGYFYVEGVAHNGTQRQMTLTLSRSEMTSTTLSRAIR